jgi:hypothetical protein
MYRYDIDTGKWAFWEPLEKNSKPTYDVIIMYILNWQTFGLC